MADTNEDERGYDDIEHRVPWHQDQNPVGVGGKPDVVLGDEQLKQKKTETVNMDFLILSFIYICICYQ